jgi:hypothetical protein
LQRGDPDALRISKRAANAIADGKRQQEAQFDNFLKLLGAPRRAPWAAAQPASPAADSDAADRILTARGYRYVPDPMGRIGWGDWVDPAGKLLDPVAKQGIVESEITSRLDAIGQINTRQDRSPAAPVTLVDSESAGATTRWLHLDNAQAAMLANSEVGTRLAGALNRFREAASEGGAVSDALWRDELRKLGVEAGQIGAQSSSVILVTNPGDPQRPRSGEERSPQSFLGKAWSWLTDDFPGLAEEKARAVAQLDQEIRKIESEPGWRRNILSLVARQSLLEARTGIIGGFPTSRLDFIFAGIDVIGVGMVSGRPLLILRKGNKIITSADLAEGGFRSRHAIDVGKDLPYNSHRIRAQFEKRFGAGNVTSLTVPPADYHLIQLAGQRHPVTGIVFSNKGYPIFDDIAKFDTRLPSEVFWKSGPDTHKRAATRQLAEAIGRARSMRVYLAQISSHKS